MRFVLFTRLLSMVAGLALLSDSPAVSQSPTFSWPIAPATGADTFLLNYVDDNPAIGSQADYTCRSQYLYDGHRGTDISALNFRVMDEGVPITAVADGEVVWVRYDEFDRNYWPPYQGQPNGIGIRHAGGVETQYWHNRANSASVMPGESVAKGQMIAMVGSSGQTPIPHVHFEVREDGTFRDPFSGPCNEHPSLWDSDYPHPADTLLRILDWDIFTKTALAGNEANNYFGEKALKDRPFRPDVFGADEPTLGVWVQLQGKPGAVYTLRILAPDGSVRAEIVKGISTAGSVQWHAHYRDFAALAAGLLDSWGTWRVELEFQDAIRHVLDFHVGRVTEFAPRFFPLAGKSIRWGGHQIREQLELSGREGPVTFHAPDRPEGVEIDGSDVVFTAAFDPPTRNSFVSVVARDAEGRTDTMRYHIVDLGKPAELLGTSSEHYEPATESVLENAYPNPFLESTVIPFSLNRAGRVVLSVLDLRGRSIGVVMDEYLQAGRYEKELSLNHLPAGVYIVQFETPMRKESRLIVKAR